MFDHILLKMSDQEAVGGDPNLRLAAALRGAVTLAAIDGEAADRCRQRRRAAATVNNSGSSKIGGPGDEQPDAGRLRGMD